MGTRAWGRSKEGAVCSNQYQIFYEKDLSLESWENPFPYRSFENHEEHYDPYESLPDRARHHFSLRLCRPPFPCYLAIQGHNFGRKPIQPLTRRTRVILNCGVLASLP